MGLGDRRRRAGDRAVAPLRLGDRAERPHPPGAPEGRGARDLPHRVLDRVSAARAGYGARTGAAHGAGRAAAQYARPARGELEGERRRARRGGLEAGLAGGGRSGEMDGEETSGDGTSVGASPSDEALMRALARGSDDALRELYARHAPLVYAVAVRSLDRPAA